VRTAILDGAEQIVVPATVSLLCICIAFAPLFALSGVAGYLFRPLAEAVVFAMVASYLLSRTLVPTMANYLLRQHAPVAHPAGAASDAADYAPPQQIRNPLVRFQQGFERAFEAVRSRYLGVLQLCLGNRRKLITGFMGFTALSFALAPSLGQDFFPYVDGGQIALHVRAQTGTRIEETTKLADRVAETIRKIIPASEIGSIVDNIGLSISGINMAYNNSGTIGVEDADILITLTPKHEPTADYVKTMREQLPRRFPGSSFSFLPADMVSQILNFGSPAPIDLQIVGSDLGADRKYADELLPRIARIAGVADARIQQAFEQPTLNVSVDRSLAGLVSVSEKDAATAMQTTLSGSLQTDQVYWLN
jgi:multidrug efflux pump subunit AcrB